MNCGSDQWVKGTLPKYRHISHDQLKLAACDPDSYSNLAVNCVSLYNTERLLPVCGERIRRRRQNMKSRNFGPKKVTRARSHELLCPDLNNAFAPRGQS